jgi:glyoxylase-like metal-dependent hydrolase (beta-lactamase superfamily II)
MIPYVRDFDFAYGRSDRVSPLIRRVVADNPGPFTFTGTGTYLIGLGEVAVIDPGPALPAHLDALLAAVQGERVTQILVTHTHADHSPLARPFALATGAPIAAAAPPAPRSGPEARIEEDEDAGFAPDQILQGGEILSGPGWTIEALATPGHASNHLAFALLEENALFSGDHIMGWSTTVVAPPDGDMSAYYDSLERVAARDFTTLWPTHGPPITDPAPFIAAYKAHRLAREGQILEHLAAGPASAAELVPGVYAAVDHRLWPAASQSLLAHLIHLRRTGAVESDGAPDARARFRVKARP